MGLELLCPKKKIQTKIKGKIFDMLAFMLVPQRFAISQKVESFSLAGLLNSSRTLCVLLADNSKSSGVCVLLSADSHHMSRRGRESDLASKHRRINRIKNNYETQKKLKVK